ncbi:hypothetical protein TBLA_0E01050 [Henningerozyma blattae CBS 6284]|uniref:chitinase n=1 Tax=Henningerozyma blattae (strain ATCC 34711 / CBS 6284 / DSM 70876 / NBRC 10599 / NRRL Y-10934 / UCD 77-7) TaxID=1071380 RepID=I2H463_HENB6|nr:hypothetical protein TBLA_0E01050 [Tetrapisispora blattae CBS 6284]CCH61165.1 hypothetical protein TBLA_0E01050 [Tetrapisispora blattae CBS 6284]
MYSTISSFALLFTFLISLVFAFDADSNKNVAVYWGQNSAGDQESLATYCLSNDADIFLLSFIYEFPSLGLNFANACTNTFSDGLLHCPEIAQDIKTCQSLGKKVLLSMGGASGAYGFSGDAQAEEFATTLWNTFGEGNDSSVERPFDDAIVDGFDFDIENNNGIGYAALVSKLRTLFEEGSKRYYISAAPQCPYPDVSVGDLLANSDVDFAFIQFYNNYCNVDKQFNWDTWADFAANISPNPNIKLYLGLPGSATAAGSGYVSDMSSLASVVESISTSSNFGGISLWDASQAFSNKIDGISYVEEMKNILNDNANSGSLVSSTVSSAAPSTSTEVQSTATTSSPAESIVITSSPIESSTATSSTTISSATTSAPVLVETTTVTPMTTTTSTVTANPSTSASQTNTPHQTTTLDGSSQVTSAPVITTQASNTAVPTERTTTTIVPSPSATQPGSVAHIIAQEMNARYAAGQFDGKELPCIDGSIACSSDGSFAICNYGEWVIMECAAGTTCYAFDQDDTVTTGCNFISLRDNFF